MPRAEANTDRRRHGRGDNVGTKITAKANLADQRSKSRYAPPAPTAGSEFSAGVSAGRPMSRGATVGQGTTRSVGKVGKLGGKA